MTRIRIAVAAIGFFFHTTQADWLSDVMTDVPGHHCRMVGNYSMSVCDGAWGRDPPPRPTPNQPHHWHHKHHKET